MFKHKGGNLQTWNADGTKGEVIYYGKDLDKPCPECKQTAFKPCVTASGKPLGKTHKARA